MSTQMSGKTLKQRLSHFAKMHPYLTSIFILIVIAVAVFTSISLHQAGGSARPVTKSASASGHRVGNSSSSASSASTSSSAGSSTAVATAPTKGAYTVGSAGHSSSTNASGRDVVKTASLQLSVKDTSGAASKLTKMTQSIDGFVASMNETSNTDRHSAKNAKIKLQLRVPNSDLNRFLAGAKGLGSVQSFTQTGQDVTNQHNALTQQLNELKSESHAYTRLYNKAKSMSDMIQIQKSLSEVNSQMNHVQAQLHQLNRSVSLATINVTLVPAIANLPQGTTNAGGAIMSSLHFMRGVGHGLAIFVAWLLPWAVLASLIFVIVKLVKMRRRRH